MRKIRDNRVNANVNDVVVVDWTSFKQRFADQLHHVVGFEELFIDNVLSHIPQISPTDVIPQYHFTDETGNRYIDFMIINPDRGWCLPIELDGYSKMVGNENNYAVFNDFLTRQNAIIKQFGLVLRYTNKTMINNPELVIAEIQDTLEKQENNQSVRVIEQQHKQALINDYQQQIKALKAHKQKPSDIGEIAEQLNQIKAQLSQVNSANKVVTEPVVKEKTSKLKWFVGFIVVLVVAFAGLIFADSLSKQDINQTQQWANSEPAPQPEPVVEMRMVEPEVNLPQMVEGIPQEVAEQPAPKKIEKIKPVIEETLQAPQTQLSKEYVVIENTEAMVEEAVDAVIAAAKETQEPVAENKLCGQVSEIKGFAKGTYLNLDGSYPNHSGSITLWNIPESDAYYLLNTSICVNGKIEFNKGKPRINAYSLKAFYSY